MIIWLNGAFGSGKTHTAYELKWRIPNAVVFDPEEVGYFLRNNLPKEIQLNDFQDFPMWREFNFEMIRYIYNTYKGVIIIPMTMVNESYFNEIVGRIRSEGIQLKHFTLMAQKETLIKRLRKRGDGKNSWPVQQIDRCILGLKSQLFDEHINTDDRTIEQVVEYIAKVCNIQLLVDNRNWLIRKRDKLALWFKHIRLFV
jgi:hypothetical protein